MSQSFSLTDTYSLDDLHVYLSRASRVEDGAVRLIASGDVLAVYTAILYPRGLLDSSPTVLGLRTLRLSDPVDLDQVVPVRSLLERLVRLQADAEKSADSPVSVALPPHVGTASWAGISPPRGGWLPMAETDAALLEIAARAGIDEVALAIPTGTGEQLVQKVRSEVWSRPVEGADRVPSGAAFAAYSLGFLSDDEPVRLFESGPWTRLTTSRGHVLVRRTGAGLRP